jgi:hypothetical protein
MTLKRERDRHAPGGIRTRSPSKLATTDPHLRPRATGNRSLRDNSVIIKKVALHSYRVKPASNGTSRDRKIFFFRCWQVSFNTYCSFKFWFSGLHIIDTVKGFRETPVSLMPVAVLERLHCIDFPVVETKRNRLRSYFDHYVTCQRHLVSSARVVWWFLELMFPFPYRIYIYRGRIAGIPCNISYWGGLYHLHTG